ncbi:MAG: hypothetical protein KBS52_05030 [Clostridiales bacterium]|nr:hypothetical protein [Candidatus Equinaster intestinalis]
MKKTAAISFCGIMSALSVVIMLAAYFPYFTYAVPAIAGFLVLITYIEAGPKWSVAVYIVTSVLVMLFCENEAKLMYLLLFGYYPILKIYVEKLKSKILVYVLKFAVFNASIAVVYLLLAKLFGIETEVSSSFGIIGVIGIVLLGNFTFWLYDIVLVRMANVYLARLHKTVRRIFK